MTPRLTANIALSGIASIIVAMSIGPYFSHPAYDWIAHTTSELAGQGMPNAWIMRLGFAVYGLFTAVAALSLARLAPLLMLAMIAFGIGLIGAAIWSSATFPPAPGFDWDQDWVHSVFANQIGAAFAAMMVIRLVMHRGGKLDWLSWLGLIAAILIPLAMFLIDGYAGLLQRLMFVISFVWVAREFAAPSARASIPGITGSQ